MAHRPGLQQGQSSSIATAASAVAAVGPKWPNGISAVPWTGANTSPKLTSTSSSYYAITLGANLKPTVPKEFEGIVLRPEVRWDHSTATQPFDGGTSSDPVTVGADVVVPFVLSH